MARVKDWLIDIESYTWEAIEKELSLKDTIAYVKRNMKTVDESYIRQIYEEYAMAEYNKRHGGPWDRGAADSYYRREYDPHYYVEGTYSSPRVSKEQMTEEEIAAYKAGWDYNEMCGDFKDWR